MLDQGRINAAAMITGVIGYNAFAAAFEGLKTPSDQCKIMLDPTA